MGNVIVEILFSGWGKNMEVKVVDFWINAYGGFTIKYSDGSTRSLCKEHLIEVLNGER